MNEAIIPLIVVFAGLVLPVIIGAITLKKAKLSYGWLFVNSCAGAGWFVVFGSLLRAAKLNDQYFTDIDGYSVNLKHGLIRCSNCDRVKKLGKSRCDKCKEPLPAVIKCKECGSRHVKLYNKHASKITITGIILMFAISASMGIGNGMMYEYGGNNPISTILFIVMGVCAVLFIADMHAYGIFKRLYVRCESCGAKYPGTEITSITMAKIKREPAAAYQNSAQPAKSYASNDEPAYKYSSKGGSTQRKSSISDGPIIKCAKCSHEFNWDDAFYQRYTIGAAPSNGDFWPRVFCPGCGALIADWSKWMDDYKWYGNNAVINKDKHLPAGALDYHVYRVEGEAITKINQYSIDLDLAKQELSKLEKLRAQVEKSKRHPAGSANTENSETGDANKAAEAKPIEIAERSDEIEGDYVSACLEKKYKNLEETRSYSEDRFVKIPTMLNSGYNKEALEQLEAMISEHTDYDMLYTWQAIALTRLGEDKKAYDALSKGLEASRQKHSICLELAKIDINRGDIKNAVHWLSQCILCMDDEQSGYQQIRAQAYLYLVYIAKGFNMPKSETRYRSIVNMNWYSLDFSGDVAMNIVRHAQSKKDSDMAAVLKRI